MVKSALVGVCIIISKVVPVGAWFGFWLFVFCLLYFVFCLLSFVPSSIFSATCAQEKYLMCLKFSSMSKAPSADRRDLKDSSMKCLASFSMDWTSRLNQSITERQDIWCRKWNASKVTCLVEATFLGDRFDSYHFTHLLEAHCNLWIWCHDHSFAKKLIPNYYLASHIEFRIKK